MITKHNRKIRSYHEGGTHRESTERFMIFGSVFDWNDVSEGT